MTDTPADRPLDADGNPLTLDKVHEQAFLRREDSAFGNDPTVNTAGSAAQPIVDTDPTYIDVDPAVDNRDEIAAGPARGEDEIALRDADRYSDLDVDGVETLDDGVHDADGGESDDDLAVTKASNKADLVAAAESRGIDTEGKTRDDLIADLGL